MVNRSKKGLVLVLIYSSITLFILYFLIQNVYPKDIDCPVHNTKLKIESKLNTKRKIESKLNTKLKIESKLTNELETNVKHSKSPNGWTQMTGDIFVYSAFLDACPSGIPSSLCVMCIGLTLTNTSVPSFNCAVKTASVVSSARVSVEILPEHHSFAYSAALFYCAVESEPELVALYTTTISKWIPIRRRNIPSTSLQLSLCVRPLYGYYSSVYLSEFLAYYSTMGVNHFIFYQQNTSDSVFLKFLQSANLGIDVLLWDIPFTNDLIHENGQLVFTQDCIFRSKHKFSHTIIVDLDEFIVPKMHTSIKDLILYLDGKYQNAGSYTIPMVMFCKEFSREQDFSLIKSNKRQKTPWAHGFRSKYILRPDRVNFAGIHFVWKHAGNWFEVKVSDSVALLHHYRRCCGVLQSWFFHLFAFHVLEDQVVIDNTLINLVANHTLVTFILNLANLTNYQVITL